MESEVELNEVIQQMHVVATVPDLYHILVDLNAVQSLQQLLSHENTGTTTIYTHTHMHLFVDVFWGVVDISILLTQYNFY